MKKYLILTILIFLTVITIALAIQNRTKVEAQTDIPWPMAGANPERTSWTPENIPGNILAKWAKPIEPYIQQKVQLIAAEGKIFISTAKGLYAINAETGADAWVYPTELPLGNSPTYNAGYLYVGGFDRMVHKVNAQTGASVWKSPPAEGSFQSNPLVVENKVIIGNKDGNLYAYDTQTGNQIWKFTTATVTSPGGPILSSAAYKDGVVYFGANDMSAYAVNAANGQQIWKSDKLHGKGFYFWWPVVYKNHVIFTRSKTEDGRTLNVWLFPEGLAEDIAPGTLGKEPGDWVANETTVNVNTIDTEFNPNGQTYADYFEKYPHYRSAFFIDRTTGKEVIFDVDSDSKPDGPPFATDGDAGDKYPPVISGFDNVLYIRNITNSSGQFAGAMLTGWKIGTPFLSLPVSSFAGVAPDLPEDEPTGFSAAGNKLYWNHTSDRYVGAADISKPNTTWPVKSDTRQWRYLKGGDTVPATDKMPVGYHKEVEKFYWNPPNVAVRWGENAKVGPTIYKGKMYVAMSNAIVAFSADGTGANATVLPTFKTVIPPSSPLAQPSKTALTLRLESQVQAIINAGHLKPSKMSAGAITFRTSNFIEDHATHYWHNPADLHYFLLRAYPHITNSTLKSQVVTYLKSEYATYPPYTYNHIGWTSGTPRDPYIYPPLEDKMFDDVFFGPQTGSGGPTNTFSGWSLPYHNFYAVWKAAVNGVVTSATAWSQVSGKLDPAVPETKMIGPHVRNSYLTGLKGYIELAKLAGQPLSSYQIHLNTYNAQLNLRSNEWTDFPTPHSTSAPSNEYFYTMITAWNFMYLTPEVVNDLSNISGVQTKMINTISKYEQVAPYWMVAHNGETQGESAYMPYQQTHSLYQAKAMIANESYDKLTRYLDSPILAKGDLYYIDNLVSAIEADGNGTITQGPTATNPQPTNNILLGDINGDNVVNSQDYVLLSNAFGSSDPAADLDDNGTVNVQDFTILSNNFGKTNGTIPSATPYISATPTPTPQNTLPPQPGSALNAGAGLAFNLGATTPDSATLENMRQEAISEAFTEYKAKSTIPPKIIMVINNTGEMAKLITDISSKFNELFPGSSLPPITGTGTSNLDYNAFENDAFVEHQNKSISVLLLGGNSIEKIYMAKEAINGPTPTGTPAETLYFSAGRKLGVALKPQINPGKTNIIYMFGPGHNPKMTELLNGMKTPEALGDPMAGYIKVIGSAAYVNGSSISNSVQYPSSVTAVLIQGNFSTALSGKGVATNSTDVSASLNQIKSELSGNPDVLFFVPGHPAAGTYAALKNTMTGITGSTPIFGHEGGGEYGHLTTSSQPIAVPNHYFILGVKGK